MEASKKSTHKEKVTITRGMSLLTCGYHNEEDVNGGTFIEKFDESQNFYGDLIHSSEPTKMWARRQVRDIEEQTNG